MDTQKGDMSIIKLDGHTNMPKSILDGHTKGRYVDNKTRWTHEYAKEYTKRTHKRAICR